MLVYMHNYIIYMDNMIPIISLSNRHHGTCICCLQWVGHVANNAIIALHIIEKMQLGSPYSKAKTFEGLYSNSLYVGEL